MNNNYFKLNRLQFIHHLKTKNVLIGLVLTTTIIVQPGIVKANQTPQPSQTTPSSPIKQQLIGHWQVKNLTNSQVINFIFTPDEKLFMWGEFEKIAYGMNYKVNSEAKPIQLDIIPKDPSQKVETILEMTVDGKMRLEILNANPGQSRPNSFSPDTPIFERISQTTVPPKNIKFVDPSDKQSLMPEAYRK
ncbi:hypothetical protein [Brunnivagina elsteri]|uniref:Uncharacterized protein n=1 Tax=Brunnivagina elsteri CCALA 953 TaxID=987040 RepID=A0A2A2TPC9_9CYAN|nr:hypothetical protein [Calothrix elsteri]PAX60386.1 hypothetical protein CK510_02135 [Calothrix elsteri CCALA 953]